MPGPYPVKIEHNVGVAMRDGITTYADVFRPDVGGKFPAILTRTPYNKSDPITVGAPIDAIHAATRGYAMVLQDVRGRYASEGEFYAFVNEIEDGYDSVEWVASQSWCNGKVGMQGISYTGATQWLAAKSRPPSLTAIAPGFTASDYHEGWTWQGGAFELGFNLSWTLGALVVGNWPKLSEQLRLPEAKIESLVDAKDHLKAGFRYLPLQDYPYLQDGVAPYYFDWLSHPEYDDYWRAVCVEDSHSEMAVPALNYGGWYDIFQGGTLRNFSGMRESAATEQARNGQRLLVGPWVHQRSPTSMAGSHNFGTRASGPWHGLQERQLRFYDLWLKGLDNGLLDAPPVEIFVMGANVWRDEDEWPLARAEDARFYLRGGGRANTLNGDGALSLDSPGDEPPDAFLYNPGYPVPTTGGGLCCDPAFMAWGAYDQRDVEARSDVLVYSTAPLEEDTEVTGPITVTLYASSSAPDTDFTAKLVDVDPTGYARNLTDGIIRARFRTPRSPASLIQPGQVYEYHIDLWATSNVFMKGHTIRLEVSSSNFPRFDRNPNTGGPIGEETEMVPAVQTVYHTSQYPSHVTLPVVPAA